MTPSTTGEIVRFDRNAALAGPDNCELIIRDEQAMEMVASSLPGNMDPQRRRDKTLTLIREATIHIANSDCCDAICRCAGASILDSLVSCARLDLSLTKALGHAYLIPFGGVCTLMIGYKGFIKLIIETGFIRHLETVVVYEDDEYSFYRDEAGPHLRHVPNPESQGDNSKVRLVYLIAKTTDGDVMFESMNNAELEKVRKASKQPNGPAYKAWPTEMKRKAVIRRFEKSIPKGMNTPAERRLAEALDLDNSQFNPSKMAEYKEIAAEHSRSLKDEAMAPVVGDDQPVTKPKAVAPARVAKFMARVAAKRDDDSSLTDAEFVTQVLESEFGQEATCLSDLTPEEFDRIGKVLAGGEYDWATGEKVPAAEH